MCTHTSSFYTKTGHYATTFGALFPFKMTMATAKVMASATANEAHTPVKPKSFDKAIEQMAMATNPRRMDMTNAPFGRSTALRYPDITIFAPEKRNPRK